MHHILSHSHQYTSMARNFQDFQLVDHKTFFFHICISFGISRSQTACSQTALLKMWLCVSWSPLVDSFRRLQTPIKGEKLIDLERPTLQIWRGTLAHCQTSKLLSLHALYMALLSSKNIAAPLQHKLTSLSWTAKIHAVDTNLIVFILLRGKTLYSLKLNNYKNSVNERAL